MIWRIFKIGTLSLVWVVLLSFALFFLNIGKISPIDGSKILQTGLLCNDASCANQESVQLPFFAKPSAQNLIVSQTLNFQFSYTKSENETELVFFFPKVADDFSLSLNGFILRQIDEPGRNWNRPFLIKIPPSFINEGVNALDIIVFGQAQEGLEIQPFFFGPQTVIEPAYNKRWLSQVGVSIFTIGLMTVLFAALGLVWLSRPKDQAYMWLSLSCLSACLFVFQYSADTSFMNYKIWTSVWGLSVSFYVFCIMKFLNRFLGFESPRIEKWFVWFLILSAITLALVPTSHTFMAMIIVNYGTELFALTVLITFWISRQSINKLDFNIFYACLSSSAALGFYGLVRLTLDEPPRNLQIFQFMPVVMAALCLWLIMSQLLRNLRDYEQLNASLQETITQKTAELAQSYQQLAKAQRAEAIHSERQRIMSDLHDGIGGQLVNTLAYMQNNDKGDEVMRNALEDALRDLSLMLDSLETDDSIVTLLGMLRTRLEALLEKHGLEFDWQIEDEPVLKNPSPSNNLHLTRIVQEAITNIIKHANASVITVSTDASSVLIKDNGDGFEQADKSGSGHGITGMIRRAEQVGANLTIESDVDGTVITIDLD